MAGRITQIADEVLVQPDGNAARVTQIAVEAFIGITTAKARMTQGALEVLISALNDDTCYNAWTLPSPSAYPMPAAGGPQYTFFEQQTADWHTRRQEFADGGAAYRTNLSTAILRWVIEYEGLSEIDAAVLDDHYNTARGDAGFTFSLTDPRTATVHTGVRYQAMETGTHQKKWAQTRRVILIKYPQ